MTTIRDNHEESRFELTVGEEMAVAYYAKEKNRMVLLHTEVPPALSGQGIGSKLARFAFEAARAKNQRVIAKCPFMSAWAAKHSEFAALLDG